MPDRIEERVNLQRIRYANCWEDADILCEALRPRPGMRMLSIASAGDNSLALAAEGAEVVAVDLSQAQLACVELRMAAFRKLDYEHVLAFLGVRECTDRLATFDRMEAGLSVASRDFWKSNWSLIEGGAIHAGKFESYFRTFRTRVIPCIHSQTTVRRLLEEKGIAARREFYDRVWNNRRWRLLFKVFFSRAVMGRMGRDPEFFRYVEGTVSERILARAKYALTELPTHANPFLEYILTGNFEKALPRYLRRENFEAVRAAADRLTLFRGSVEEAARLHGPFDGFNLSDVFEYLDPPTCRAIYGQLLAAANPGARLAYWNMLVPRRCPEGLPKVKPMDDLARRLFELDLAFFYSAFVVDEVKA